MADKVTNKSGDTVHTCNPNRPGMPLPFGKKDPENCERCKELANGAPARTSGWGDTARRREQDAGLTAADYRAHRRTCDRCQTGAVCTFGDW